MLRSLGVLVLLARVAAATTYHVAVTGHDTGTGAAGDPFLTIGKCAAVAQPGDTCQVHAGTYRETVAVTRSGTAAAHIRFEAAPGECVTVAGTSPVTLTTGWAPAGNHIYVATTTDSITQLFADGAPLVEARWPNADPLDLVHAPWAVAGAGTDTAGLVATGAPAGDWTGGVVLVLPGMAWSSDTRSIASYDQNTKRVTFDSALTSSAGPPAAGSHYILFGARAGLDGPGEWFFDPATHQLYVYMPGGGDPTGHVLEAKQRMWAFTVTADYVDIVGFWTFGSTIELQNANHCTVDGVIGHYVTSMRATSDQGVPTEIPTMIGNFNTWKNSVVAYAASGGLQIRGTDNVIVNNIFHDIDEMATNEAAIDIDSPWFANLRNLIAYNTIAHTGRAGIYLLGAQHSRALYNRVDDIGTSTDDLGGIYTYGTDGSNSEIAYNEVSHSDGFLGAGIYLDDQSKNWVVHHNYVHDSASAGIVLKDVNAVFSNTVRAAVQAPLEIHSRPDGTWGAIEQALVADNVTDGSTDLTLALHLATQTDYGDFATSVLATDTWQHITIPFSALAQPTWAATVPYDLTQAQRFTLSTMTAGDYDIQIRNVQLEGATPRLVSSFASNLNSSFGTTWGAGGGQGSTMSAAIVNADPSCAFSAAELTGTVRENGYAGFGLNLSTSNAAVDLSGYTGVSFDVRARSRVWLQADYPTTHAPVQTLNASCPDDATGSAASTSCAVGQGIAIPPYTTGTPDLGAFPAGVPPWTAGAQLVEPTPGTCTPPVDITMNLPPANIYPPMPSTIPTTPALVAFDQSCSASGTDAGIDAAIPDAGPRPDGGSTNPADNGGGGGCCDTGSGVSGSAILAIVVVASARRRRARRR